MKTDNRLGCSRKLSCLQSDEEWLEGYFDSRAEHCQVRHITILHRADRSVQAGGNAKSYNGQLKHV